MKQNICFFFPHVYTVTQDVCTRTTAQQLCTINNISTACTTAYRFLAEQMLANHREFLGTAGREAPESIVYTVALSGEKSDPRESSWNRAVVYSARFRRLKEISCR